MAKDDTSGSGDAFKFLWISLFIVGFVSALTFILTLIPSANILVTGHPPIMFIAFMIAWGFSGLLQIIALPQALRTLVIDTKRRTTPNIGATVLSFTSLLTIAAFFAYH